MTVTQERHFHQPPSLFFTLSCQQAALQPFNSVFYLAPLAATACGGRRGPPRFASAAYAYDTRIGSPGIHAQKGKFETLVALYDDPFYLCVSESDCARGARDSTTQTRSHITHIHMHMESDARMCRKHRH